MLMRTTATLTALALIALVGACDSDGGSSEPTTTSLTPAEASQAYVAHTEARVAAECERDQRCDSPPPYASVDACVQAEVAKIVEVKRTRLAASIEAGHTLYDPTAAAACEAVLGGACSVTFLDDIAPACNPVISGNVAIDGACIAHFECADPPGHSGLGPYCFDGCEGLWGDEDEDVSGTCVLESPIATGACP